MSGELTGELIGSAPGVDHVEREGAVGGDPARRLPADDGVERCAAGPNRRPTVGASTIEQAPSAADAGRATIALEAAVNPTIATSQTPARRTLPAELFAIEAPLIGSSCSG